MRIKLFCAVALLVSAAVLRHIACAADWKPVPGQLTTPWTDKVDPKMPLPEYPRPQLVRPQWTNLNGLWDYAITELAAPQPAQFAAQILVPYPIESSLSGVKKRLLPTQRLWYHRKFTVPDLVGGKRLLLQFGAVDWEAKVFVNGKLVGEHRGGYDAFSFDITDALKPGENELVLSVFDATGGTQAKGKQDLGSVDNPGGCMYTPCSGIWQTVWLETVPKDYITGLRITPDVDAGTATITVNGPAGSAKITVLDGNKEIATAQGAAGQPIVVEIPDVKLWSPDSPFLYDLKVTLHDDAVKSYFGMRKIALGKDETGITRMMLNNKFVFQSGPLDQGFWPDGIYTAPTDEALKYDIEVTKKLGFNMARKHVKIEPARWYYWCDKLGLMVWQDMPAGEVGRDERAVSPAAARQHEAELGAMVEQHINAPSIIMWVLFNEGWGQYDTPRLTKWVKQLDPSRLASNASGGSDRNVGDVIDMHAYPGPASPQPEAQRAAVLGEFGGLGLPTHGHQWVDKAWGYQKMPDAAALNRRYLALWKKVAALKDKPGLSAAVYTQITDVETESNGLMTYDRKVIKIDSDRSYAALVRGQFSLSPVKEIVPTSLVKPVLWRYTTKKPADDWCKPAFDATTWKEGPAGFGSPNMPNGKVRTLWLTDNIWIRREVEIPAVKLHHPTFRIYHDEDADVYVNGVLALKVLGFNCDYEDESFTPAGAAALKPGKNVIAVHVHQTVGGQYIDLGIVDEIPATK